MEFGVFLPVSGRAAGPDTLSEAARQADALGFKSVWAADRIVIPWDIRTPYPYSKEQQFIVPPERPFFEPLTCLAFLAGVTGNILLGMSVLVLPYRHPLYWAKIATTIDHLSRGRLIVGIGVGWMAEEFSALGVPFEKRGAISDEQLEILDRLWREERPSFDGRHYRFSNIAFYPRPFGRSRLPLWVGGEGTRARRRAARYGDAWFPYFVRITPRELAARYGNIQRWAKEEGRDPDRIALNCCLPIELTDTAMPQEEDYLKGNSEQITAALKKFAAVGVQHVALQFMVPRWPERRRQIERFAREIMPNLKGE